MIVTVTITKKNPIHINFNIHVNHALSGSLVLRIEEWEPFLSLIQPDKIWDDTVMDKIATGIYQNGFSTAPYGDTTTREERMADPTPTPLPLEREWDEDEAKPSEPAEIDEARESAMNG